jgi:hypothetical protein
MMADNSENMGTAKRRRVSWEELPLERERDILREALRLVEQRLPPAWSANIDEEPKTDGRRIDAAVTLTAPDGVRGKLIVEAKRLLTPRDVPQVLMQLNDFIRSYEPTMPTAPMVVARYLPPSTRARLEEEGASYADATGNLRIVLNRPALFLHDRGADKDPWRGPGRPRGTLKGPSAARVVRALVDFAPPLTVPELASRSGASLGATYRVMEFLEREALIEREPRGPIVSADWRRLLERWSEDYGFQRSNVVARCLQPRGLTALVNALRSADDLPYALTGSLAAERIAPYAPPHLAMIYVDDLQKAIERLDLRPVSTGANALLGAGEYDVVFERTLNIDGLKIAAPSQIAVDLLTGPGRSAAEALALLDWMQAHEPKWRH